MSDEREIRIKMELVVTTKFNVAQVRENLRGDAGDPRLLHSATNEGLLDVVRKAVQTITGAKDPAKIVSYSASYNRRYGRKDGERR